MPRTSDARERLLRAALELIWANSYGSTSVDLICQRARAQKGSFYYYFSSKAELAAAALEADWRERKQVLDRVFAPQVAPLDRLLNYVRMLYERQAAFKTKRGCALGCHLFALGSEVSAHEPIIRDQITRILQSYLRYLAAAIREAHQRGEVQAPDADFKARVLLAYYHGLLTQARVQNDVRLLREMGRATRDLLGVTSAKAAESPAVGATTPNRPRAITDCDK